jgi:uncharacterized protein YodC (DUF2158 family)
VLGLLRAWGVTVSNEIRVGEIVKLKSGGPKMTVESSFNDAHGKRCVRCVWFDKDKLMRDAFQIDAVENVRGTG